MNDISGTTSQADTRDSAGGHTVGFNPGGLEIASSAGNTDHHFRTEHLLEDLKGRSVRGGTVTIAAQGLLVLLRAAEIMILARLLTPRDFGLVAMVTAVTGFLAMFKDMGLSMAIVQRPQVNHAQISTLFWINAALSLLLMGLLVALAPALAWLYSEPELTWITLAIAATFIFGGLGVQHQALLGRQMRFAAQAATELIATAAGIAAAIVAAAHGAGYWSLVILIVVNEFVRMLLLWGMCDWRPTAPKRGSGVRSMLAFGGNLAGSQFLAYSDRHADNMMIGWVWGAGSLGFYAKAYHLLMLPIQAINSPIYTIAIPVLSRLQGDIPRYRRYYRSIIGLIVSLGMPIVAFTFVDAERVISVLFGNQWSPSVPIFMALAPGAFIGTFNIAGGSVLVSTGRTDRLIRVNFMVTLVMLIAFAIGLNWGPMGVALGFSAAQCLARVPTLLYAFAGTPVNISILAAALWRPATASVAAAALLWYAGGYAMATEWTMVHLALDAVLFMVIYLLVWVLLPGGFTFSKEIFRSFSHLRIPVPAV